MYTHINTNTNIKHTNAHGDAYKKREKMWDSMILVPIKIKSQNIEVWNCSKTEIKPINKYSSISTTNLLTVTEQVAAPTFFTFPNNEFSIQLH